MPKNTTLCLQPGLKLQCATDKLEKPNTDLINLDSLVGVNAVLFSCLYNTTTTTILYLLEPLKDIFIWQVTKLQ